MIPTTPTDNWFKTLNSLTTQFYWKYKKPRISLSTLQNKKSHGGLEAPNFHHYFLANQLQMDQHIKAQLPMAGTGTKPMYKYLNCRPPLPLTIKKKIQLLPAHYYQLNSDSLVENEPNHKIITGSK